MADPASILPLHRLHPQQAEDLPRPPFSATFRDYLILGVSYDRAAVRHLVPDELGLPDPVPGFMAMGHATSGWGMGDFSNFYLALAVEGLPAPDGTPAHFRPLNIYSPKAADLFRHHYNHRMLAGDHRFPASAGRHEALVTASDGLTIRLAVTGADGGEGAGSAGVHHYLGQDRMGEVTSFFSSYTADFIPVEVEEFAVTGPDAALRLPRPTFTWGIRCPVLTVTIGEPRGSPFAALAGEPGAAALTAILARIGLAAAVVGAGGRVLSANAAARALQRRTSPALLASLALPSRPKVLQIAETGLPVIAQSLALDAGLLRQPAALVLFRDPKSPAAGDPTAVLELLGLTPAEARLAATVGAGLAPAEAAGRLGIQTSTARSQLKVVFEKLGVSRQSELSRLVATLGPG